MFKILSSKRYWSLIGKIADDQETIKGQAKVISAQQDRIKDLSSEIGDLKRKLYGESSFGFGGFTMQKSIDYPPTKKIPDPFAFDFPGTEKTFDDFWAKFTGPKNKES